MARKSNKTAHVLNLIAGHDSGKDTLEVASEETISPDDNSAPAPDPAPGSVPMTQAGPTGPQNISVIDTTVNDPVADLIQEKLEDELQRQAPGLTPETPAAPAANQESTIQAETTAQAEPLPESVSAQSPAGQAVQQAESPGSAQQADAAEVPAAQEPEPAHEEAPATTQEPQPAREEAPATTQEPQPTHEEVPAAQEPQPAHEEAPAVQEQQPAHMEAPAAQEPEPAPEPKPEPDFVRVNVKERIVEDKIIYYMRQFDVCTCDRCVADTIALTLSGMLPKYIVTTPAAVDPLLSFYTNRYISDVTVEATKACMIVKENPRH